MQDCRIFIGKVLEILQSCMKFVLSVKLQYRQVSNIRRTLLGNTIVDHSDVVGA